MSNKRSSSQPSLLRYSDIPHVHFRIYLLWVQRSSLQSLSTTVIREICSYYWFTARLLTKCGRQLLSFDVKAKTWTHECDLDSKSPLTGAIVLSERLLFATFRRFPRSTVLVRSGVICDLPDLRKVNYGLFYDLPRHRICVFGGRHVRACDGVDTSRCMQLPLAEKQWSRVAGMLCDRGGFSPCWHCGLVYLCGGWCAMVETFDPSTDTFQVVSGLNLSIHLDTTAAVSHGAEIILISKSAMIAWSPGKRTIWTVSGYYGGFSPNACVPVAVDGWLFFALSCTPPQCGNIDLVSGTLYRDNPQESIMGYYE